MNAKFHWHYISVLYAVLLLLRVLRDLSLTENIVGSAGDQNNKWTMITMESPLCKRNP